MSFISWHYGQFGQLEGLAKRIIVSKYEDKL
jgi:hypothetical protein